MGHKKKQVALKDIYLDLNNPRHDPLPNEAAAIAHLVENEKVKALAKDIAAKGGISPLDGLGVFPSTDEPNKYISAEGNRRICALKLLANPEKAPNEQDKNYFKKLAEQVADLNRVDAVIFKDRESAQPWVDLRHSGEQSGVGTRRWNTDQKARFSSQQGKVHSDQQASLLIEYAIKSRLIPDGLRKEIATTTVTRYLSNKIFRNTLGLKNKQDLTITVPPEEFNKVIQKFLKDAADKESPVSSRTNAEERENYANTLVTAGIAPKTKNLPATKPLLTENAQSTTVPVANPNLQGQPQPEQAQREQSSLPATPELIPLPQVPEYLQNNVGQNPNPTMANTMDRPFSMPNPGEDQRQATPFAPTTSDQKSDITPAAPRMRNNQSPKKRKKVIPSSYAAKIYNPVLKRIYDELRTLEADDFPFAANYLMRAFIENLMDAYLKQEFGSGPKELHKKFSKVSQTLADKQLLDTKQLKFLNTLTAEKDNPFSPDSVGHYVHGGSTPIKEVILTLWDNLEEVITCVLGELK